MTTKMRDHPESCTQFQAYLALYVGGDLDLPVMAEVTRHLEECGACRRAARAAERARGAMTAALGGGPVPDLWPAVRERLHAQGLIGSREDVVAAQAKAGDPGEREAAPRPWISGRVTSWWTGLAVTAAAAGVLGLVWLYGGEPTPSPVDPPAPVVVVEHHAPVEPIADPIADQPVVGPRADLAAAGTEAQPVRAGLRLVAPGESRLLMEGGRPEEQHRPAAWPWQPARYVSPPLGVDGHIR